MIAIASVRENVMSAKIRLSHETKFFLALFLFFLLLVILCRNCRITIGPADALCPSPTLVASKNVTFTAAVKELGTTETGRQSINLGRIKHPGRYILQLANDTPPFSGHWVEWDYLALKAGGSFIWQIGQDETPPDYNYTGQATDEFCDTGARTDCRTEFEAIAGKIDERNLPKTLNDGVFPIIRIAFIVTQEQTNADLILTLSTLYSSHVPDTKDFRMQVTLQGPY
jgi:hypothetical protein